MSREAKGRLGFGATVALGLEAAARRLWLVGIVALVDVVVSFTAISPLRSLAGSLESSPAFAQLRRFDATVLIDVMRKHGAAVGLGFTALFGALLIYLPIAWLLEGGIIGLLGEGQDPRLGQRLMALGRSAGASFGRIVTAALLSLVPYVAAIVLVLIGSGVAGAMTAHWVNVRHIQLVQLLAWVPGLLLLLYAIVAADVLRVRGVLGLDPALPDHSLAGRRPARSLAGSLRMAAEPRTAGARLTFTVLWLATSWIGTVAIGRLPHHGAALAGGFLVSIVIVLLRAAIAIAGYATLVGIAVEEAMPAVAVTAPAVAVPAPAVAVPAPAVAVPAPAEPVPPSEPPAA